MNVSKTWDDVDEKVFEKVQSLQEHKQQIEQEKNKMKNNKMILFAQRPLLERSTSFMHSKAEKLIQKEKGDLIEYFDDQVLYNVRKHILNVSLIDNSQMKNLKSRSVSFDMNLVKVIGPGEGEEDKENINSQMNMTLINKYTPTNSQNQKFNYFSTIPNKNREFSQKFIDDCKSESEQKIKRDFFGTGSQQKNQNCSDDLLSASFKTPKGFECSLNSTKGNIQFKQQLNKSTIEEGEFANSNKKRSGPVLGDITNTVERRQDNFLNDRDLLDISPNEYSFEQKQGYDDNNNNRSPSFSSNKKQLNGSSSLNKNNLSQNQQQQTSQFLFCELSSDNSGFLSNPRLKKQQNYSNKSLININKMENLDQENSNNQNLDEMPSFSNSHSLKSSEMRCDEILIRDDFQISSKSSSNQKKQMFGASLDSQQPFNQQSLKFDLSDIDQQKTRIIEDEEDLEKQDLDSSQLSQTLSFRKNNNQKTSGFQQNKSDQMLMQKQRQKNMAKPLEFQIYQQQQQRKVDLLENQLYQSKNEIASLKNEIVVLQKDKLNLRSQVEQVYNKNVKNQNYQEEIKQLELRLKQSELENQKISNSFSDLKNQLQSEKGKQQQQQEIVSYQNLIQKYQRELKEMHIQIGEKDQLINQFEYQLDKIFEKVMENEHEMKQLRKQQEKSKNTFIPELFLMEDSVSNGLQNFKDNIQNILIGYSQKLQKYNSNEEYLIKIEKENVHLKQERDTLLKIVQNQQKNQNRQTNHNY